MSLQEAVKEINGTFGDRTIMRLGDREVADVEVVSTGALPLDLALGVGGLPRGRIVEVFGPESAGKTTLLYHVFAAAQRAGDMCAFVDAEHGLDPAYAARIGVDIDSLLISQPDYGEQGLEVASILARTGEVAVIGVDSVAALTPKAELDGAMGDQFVGLHPRMMSQAMRKLTARASQSNTLLVFTNQIRNKVGVIYGSAEVQPGGRALPFYAAQRIDLRRIETLKSGTEAIGQRVRAKIVKNKVAAPYRTAEFDIDYGQGISGEGCLLDMGIEAGLVTKSGSHYSYGDTKLGNGKPAAKATLREDAESRSALEARLREGAT